MIIYLPCKLGEKFIEQKFKNWTEEKRVYTNGGERTLKGFDAFDCITRSLAIPTISTESNFVSYDPLGEFPQEFIPKYKICVDIKTEYKLSDRGLPSGKTGRLCGLVKQGEYILADFVMNDRCEHLRYVIKDNIKYSKIDEEPTESKIEYDCEAQEEKAKKEHEARANIKVLDEIREKGKKPKKKGITLKDIIKTKMKKIER